MKGYFQNKHSSQEVHNKDWEKIKSNNNFIEKYYYIDWDRLKFLNNYSSVHQILSVYRLISPVCTLVLPIVILLSLTDLRAT